jgi:hypothetical protein
MDTDGNTHIIFLISIKLNLKMPKRQLRKIIYDYGQRTLVIEKG